MKVLVISDSHGNIVRLKHCLEWAGQNASAVIHCGDWDNETAASCMKTVKIEKFGVLGNADISKGMEEALKSANVKVDPDFLRIELAGKIIGICHYPDKLKGALESQEFDALFSGHIHSKYKEIVDKTLIVRPGALHRTTLPSFAVYDTETNDVEFVDVVI